VVAVLGRAQEVFAMKETRLRILSLAFAGATLAFLGCSSGGGGGDADPQAREDLGKIGMAYHNFNDAMRGRGPRNLEEFKPYVEGGSKTAYDGLKEGRYVFIWNVRLLDMQPPHETVLGYEKDVPTRGGPVLFGDASVKNLTAEEFKAARLAKPKP
jgi:hypothetical protein